MSNLLDKASIILTPTAYNNGEALCVKPSDGSGDFDFSRNSAATRVNAQGLVENVQILSSNLVQNPSFSDEGVQEVSNGSFSQEGSEELANSDFTNGLTSWNGGSGNTVVNNQLIVNTGGLFYQALPLTANKTYKAEINIESISYGGVKFYCQGNQSQTITTSGVHTIYIVSGSSNNLVGINPQGTFEAVVNSISFREVGQDWTLGGEATIGENKLILSGDASTSAYALQNNVFSSGKTYKCVFDVTINSGLGIKFQDGLAYTPHNKNIGLVTTSGIYTFYFTSTTYNQLVISRNDGAQAYDGSITNISVKEVGQNWTLASNWEIAENKATSNGSGLIYQTSVSYIDGKTYKVTFDADITSGSGTVRLGNTTTSTAFSNGLNELYLQTDASNTTRYIFFQGNSLVGSITNISVIEITDDTNLPRINYEGFSYQDVLGSEEIVNGDFSNGLTDWIVDDGTSWTNVNNTAFCDGNNGLIKQGFTSVLNKTYKVTFDVVNVGGGELGVRIGSGTYAWNNYPSGSYVKYLVSGSSSEGVLFYATSGWTGSIDNVSVKEYLGQEVVPDSGCGSWLFEPQSTNILTHSEDFSSWTLDNTTIVGNNTISPNGTLNAVLLKGGTNSSRHHIQKNYSQQNANTSFSVFVKGKELKYIQIATANDTNQYANFDVQDGVIGTVGSTFSNAKIKDYGNGWYRLSAVATRSNGLYISLVSGLTASWLQSWTMSNNTDGLYIWGAQSEIASYPTSYIPTEGSSVTRNQDLCTNGGSLATISSTEGTLYFEGSTLVDATTQRWISLGSGGNANRVSILFAATSRISCSVRASSSAVYDANFNIGSQTNHTKAAIRYKNNDYSFFVNGVKVNSQLSGTLSFNSPLSELAFDSADGGSKFFGKTKALAVFPYLSDAELTELTTI